MDQLAKNLPEIIKASASSSLGILALMIIALAILAFFFFGKAKVNVRVAIFVMLFAGVAVLAGVIVRQSKNIRAGPVADKKDRQRDSSVTNDTNTNNGRGRAKYPLALSTPSEDFKAGPGTYRILSAKLDQESDDKLSLSFNIRYTRGADSWSGGTLMGENFRLLVDDVPSAPTKAPSELVEKNSAKEASVVFTIPLEAKTVALQVGEPAHGVRKIPVDLKAVK